MLDKKLRNRKGQDRGFEMEEQWESEGTTGCVISLSLWGRKLETRRVCGGTGKGALTY